MKSPQIVFSLKNPINEEFEKYCREHGFKKSAVARLSLIKELETRNVLKIVEVKANHMVEIIVKTRGVENTNV